MIKASDLILCPGVYALVIDVFTASETDNFQYKTVLTLQSKPISNKLSLLTFLILQSSATDPHHSLTPSYKHTPDGFTHLTEDASLLLIVANHFYKSTDPSKPWLCLQLDPAKLSSKVVFEAAAPVGDTNTFEKLGDEEKDVPLFPHLYGPIDLDSVVEIMEVVRNIDDGSFLAIQGL